MSDVVNHSGGPLLVLGGAGTGKTRALEDRFAALTGRGVLAHRILLLCHSRIYSYAAKERLALGIAAEAMIEVPVHTWHALANHLVARHYPKLGYGNPPVLLTAQEQWTYVRELIAGESDRLWPVWGLRTGEVAFVNEVADFCIRVETALMSKQDLEEIRAVRPEWSEVIDFYFRYKAALLADSRLDYSSLIRQARRLLEQDEEVSATISKRFPHVLVDDAQEMTASHIALLQHLARENLVVAGDPDSSVESFRGAQPDWLWGFGMQFGEHKKMTLGASLRIGSPAYERTNHLLEAGGPASGQPSTPASHETQLEVRKYESLAAEAEGAAKEIRRAHLIDGVPWEDLAILVSVPRQMQTPIERALDKYDIPYQSLSGEKALESEKAVAHFIDLVRVVLDLPGGGGLATMLTSPLVGLTWTARRRMERAAWTSSQQLIDVVMADDAAAEFKSLSAVINLYAGRADECFWQVFKTSTFYQGLVSAALASPTDPAHSSLDALVTFSHSLERFVERRRGDGSIAEYLSSSAFAGFGNEVWATSGTGTGRIALCTFHAARGREWDTVVVAGCIDQWMPRGRRSQGLFDPAALAVAEVASREVEAIAAERRLFYVASTRARRKTIFTMSPGPARRGKPSRFFAEMGISPAPHEIHEGSLTVRDFVSKHRIALATPSTNHAQKVASAILLSEAGLDDPSRWYWRRGWTKGAPLLAPNGVLRTSYSRLGVYENCGLQYVLQTVLGLEGTTTHSMKFGTWIHELIEKINRRELEDHAALQRAFSRLFDESAFPNRATAAQFRRDGQRMLDVIWSQVRREVVASEFAFEFDYEGAVIRGRIDSIERLGENLILIDYKTARTAPSFKKGKESLQLAIYIEAARQVDELKALGKPASAQLVYPGHTRRDGAHTVLCQDRADADKVLATLPQMIKEIMAEDFNPSPDADCYFCEMKPLCPLYIEGAEVPQ